MNKKILYEIGVIGIIQFLVALIVLKTTGYDLFAFIRNNELIPELIKFILATAYVIFLFITWYFIFSILIHFWKNNNYNFLIKIILIIITVFLYLTPIIYYYYKNRNYLYKEK